MPVYRVSSGSLGSVEVDAPNWMSALGQGLQSLGASVELDRIACEVLNNGAVLVRDVRRGDGYVVAPVSAEAPAAAVEEEILAAEEAPEADESARYAEALTPVLPVEPEPASPERLAEIDAIVGAASRALAVQLTVEAAMRAAPAESGSVLFVQKGGALRFVAAEGPEAAKVRDLCIAGHSGVAGFCVRSGTALTIREAYQDARFDRRMDALTGYRTRGIACVPIFAAGRTVGCLEVLNALGDEGFGPGALAELDLLAEALGRRLAPAVIEP